MRDPPSVHKVENCRRNYSMSVSDHHMHVHPCGCTPEHAHTHASMYIHMHAPPHTHKFILLDLIGTFIQQMAQALNFLELKCWIVKGKTDEVNLFDPGLESPRSRTNAKRQKGALFMPQENKRYLK